MNTKTSSKSYNQKEDMFCASGHLWQPIICQMCVGWTKSWMEYDSIEFTNKKRGVRSSIHGIQSTIQSVD